VLAQPVSQIHRHARCREKIVAGSERHSSDHATAMAKTEPYARGEWFAVANLDPLRHEQRLGIADSKGLQTFQLAQQWNPDFGKVEKCVDFEQRQEIPGL